MKVPNKNGPEALEIVRSILEDAMDAKAEIVELEYADDGLEVCFIVGNFGLGATLIDRAMESKVISTIVELAKLHRKPHGKMQIELRGKPHTIIVEEYQSFGESAFRMKLRKTEMDR